MQPHIGNQGPSLPVPMASNQGQARQPLLAQNIRNNITAAGLQGSSSFTSTMPTVGFLPQNNMPNVGQNITLQNLQSVSGVPQNSVANSMGQGVSGNIYASTQRQMPGRQQGLAQQQQPQPLNPQQILYQQQLQQQYRQKCPQGNIPNSQMQSQQNLIQSSQQSVMQSNLQQNQQSSVQQSQQMLQQNPQSVLRQHPQMQPQSMLPQQQQLLGQQLNSTSMHQNQLMGQQSGMSDMQQQRLLGQQTNLSSLQQPSQQQLIGQQQLDPQNNVSGLQQQQQPQQMLGTQPGNSSIQTSQHPVHMLQQTKVPTLQQNQQNATALLPNQGQQSQQQLPQQQLRSQIQSQPGQLQQPLGMHQQQNPLHRDMQQTLQTSGPLLQSQNMSDQQKQIFQSQRPIPEAPSSSLDFTAQTGNANTADWQEEVYQKIKTMKEAYLPELNEMYQKIAGKLQQHDAQPQQARNEQLEKLKIFKQMLERIMTFLQVSKNNILPTFKDKLGAYEKKIINFLNSNRPRKPGPLMQQPQQLPPPHMQQPQQQHSQVSQLQPHENVMNSQVQSLNVQGSMNTMQQNTVTSLQHSSLSSLSAVSNASQGMITPLQPNSNIDSSQGNTPSTMQQVAVGSMQQNSVSTPPQVSTNSLSSQSGMNNLQPNLAPLQPNSSMLQHQQLKQQEQHMLQSHQMKQKLQQHQIQQQLMHKQQFLQQQQRQQQQVLQQTKLQQNAQLQVHQMPQLHQMNDMDLKMRQQLGVKAGLFQPNQRSMYHHQQLKSGSSFPISSPQHLEAGGSPQMPPHPSPEIDQPNLLSSLTKTGAPSQSANSPFVIPSPSTPLAPSPMPGESEKATSSVPPLPNAGNVEYQQAVAAVTPAQSLAIGTPGISASPLLAEFTSPDGTHGDMSTTVSVKSSVTEQPPDRLLNVVMDLELQ